MPSFPVWDSRDLPVRSCEEPSRRLGLPRRMMVVGGKGSVNGVQPQSGTALRGETKARSLAPLQAVRLREVYLSWRNTDEQRRNGSLD